MHSLSIELFLLHFKHCGDALYIMSCVQLVTFPSGLGRWFGDQGIPDLSSVVPSVT